MAFPTGWSKKHKIVIDHTKVSGTANLTDFPVLLKDGNFLADAFNNSQGKEINSNYLLNDASLKGYWRLESNGNDSGPSGYTLTLANSPSYVTGRFGNGLDLESTSSQYAYISNASCPNLEISGSQSWSAWIKAESFPTYMAIMSKENATTKRLMVDNNKKVQFFLAGLTTNEQVTSDIVLEAGVWYHVCGVYDATAGKIRIFVNGAKKEATATGNATATNGDFALGIQKAALNIPFDGVIDDAAVWSRALSDEEVLSLYKGGADLRFTSDADGTTQLAHEIIDWDVVNDLAEVWVKIPTLSYTVDTTIYVWYGNSSATPLAANDTYGSQNVWTNGFKAVYHMQGNTNDSTSNGYTMDQLGSPAFSAGKLSDGVDLGSSNSTKYLKKESDLGFSSTTNNITMQGWFKIPALPALNTQYTLTFLQSVISSTRYLYRLDYRNNGGTYQYNGVNRGSYNVTLSINTFYKFDFTVDTSNNFALYHNGASVNTGTATDQATAGTTVDEASIGVAYYAAGSQAGYLSGMFDEVRFVNAVRTAGWLATEYANQNAPGTFATGITIDVTVALSDSIGLSDINSRVQTLVRSGFDSVGLTDTTSRTVVIVRSLDNLIGLTDVINTSTVLIIALSDNMGVSDTTSRTHSVFRTNIDSIGLTDTNIPTLVLERSLADSIGLSDVVAGVSIISVNVSDIMGISDTLDKILRTIGKTVVRIDIVDDIRPIIDSLETSKPQGSSNEIDGIKPILYDVREA